MFKSGFKLIIFLLLGQQCGTFLFLCKVITLMFFASFQYFYSYRSAIIVALSRSQRRQQQFFFTSCYRLLELERATTSIAIVKVRSVLTIQGAIQNQCTKPLQKLSKEVNININKETSNIAILTLRGSTYSSMVLLKCGILILLHKAGIWGVGLCRSFLPFFLLLGL